MYLFYSAAPNPGKPTKDPTHSANFGVKIKEQCETLGLYCEAGTEHAPVVEKPDVHAVIERIRL